MLSITRFSSNFTSVSIGDTRVWFSYNTPIAFKIGNNPTVVRQNVWGPTTGKHLNKVDGGAKENRLTSEVFELRLRERFDI